MKVASEIAKKNILIIDDAISMRHTIKASLRAQGFENLIEAGDGKKALALMEKKKIDLAICDWMMPNMSGLELFDALKLDDKIKQTPFILLTGNDQKESVTEAISAGVKHYMVKPFSPSKLIEKVVDLLQQKVEEVGSK
jgi:two-component system, chemotaxis family, chemotaxis protein CheY